MDEVWSVQIRHSEAQSSRAWRNVSQGKGWRLGIAARLRPCPFYINRKAWDLRVRVAVPGQHQEHESHEDASWHWPSDRILTKCRFSGLNQTLDGAIS